MKNWKKDLVEQLREKAEMLPPDTRFFSIRILMQKCRTSQRTIEEAMQSLLESRVLIHRKGKGYFTRGKTAASDFHIRLYYPQWPSLLQQNLEKSCSSYAKKQGFRFSSVPVEKREEFFEGISAEDCDALLILPSADQVSPEGIRLLQKLTIPYVLLDREAGDLELSVLSGDNYASGALAAAHLINHGHRELALLFTEPHNYSTDIRCQGFCEFSRLNGISVKVIESGVHAWDDGIRFSYAALTEHLKKNGLDFSGLFMLSSPPALEVYRAFSDAGISIPGDVSIIAHDDLPANEFLHPALDTIRVDWNRAVASCMDELRKNSDGKKKYFRSKIPPELIVRESVGNIIKDAGLHNLRDRTTRTISSK